MKTEFDYTDMLNKIRDEKISKTKTPQLNNDEINGWNNAIELCYKIVERRREKFETSESTALNISVVSGSFMDKDNILKVVTEYATNMYNSGKHTNYFNACMEDFKAGAKWALKQINNDR